MCYLLLGTCGRAFKWREIFAEVLQEHGIRVCTTSEKLGHWFSWVARWNDSASVANKIYCQSYGRHNLRSTSELQTYYYYTTTCTYSIVCIGLHVYAHATKLESYKPNKIWKSCKSITSRKMKWNKNWLQEFPFFKHTEFLLSSFSQNLGGSGTKFPPPV